MSQALLALALSLALGSPVIPWVVGLAGSRWDPDGPTKAGSVWDPDGAPADAGGVWDPNG